VLSRPLRTVRRFAAAVGVPFAFGAVHHVAAAVHPSAQDASSVTRHLVFVGINLFFAIAFVRRVRWVLFPAVILVAQQTYSHGSSFLEARREGLVDFESLAVLCFLPVVVVVSVALNRTWKPRANVDMGTDRPSPRGIDEP
jgi:hypothetical protein